MKDVQDTHKPSSRSAATLVQESVGSTAPVVQRQENRTGLPDNLKAGIESLSGHSMDDVKVHYNSAQPAQLQAHAYAQGADIHVAPGQERHLPHEAWHVVQQKQGRVKPTKQLKGMVDINDDAGLEKEADLMGTKSMQLKNKEIVNKYPLKEKKADHVPQLKQDNKQVFQLAIKTMGGTWDTQEYRQAALGDPGIGQSIDNSPYLAKNGLTTMNGVRIKLNFTPEDPAVADSIGLTQTVKSEQQEGHAAPVNPFQKPFYANLDPQIDQLTDSAESKTNPLYAAAGHSQKEQHIGEAGVHPDLGQHGFRKKNGNAWNVQDAKLEDTPALNRYDTTLTWTPYTKESQEFETSAIAIKGSQKDTFYGSVKWGWSADANGDITIDPLALGQFTHPSGSLKIAAQAWNAQPGLQELPHSDLGDVILSEVKKISQLDWSAKVHLSSVNKPAGVTDILMEANSNKTTDTKLLAIKNLATPKSGWGLTRDKKAREFYTILNDIPDNVNIFSNVGTSHNDQTAIAKQLYVVLEKLRNFKLES